MELAIRIKLNEVLEATKIDKEITKNALAREAKVRPNLIYDLCEGKTKRIELETLSTIIDTLQELTGNTYSLGDVLEYVSDKK
ncbi:helix-turn-helix domain-containing protein [Paenibacillus qinlingensis]|uniref:helix-turn-helix domain-containing protein n=1 Tax=Paenibacillus qinlingensis TaxID=1837343 RepID=UPI00156762E3|nr:helix-turn-helix transcriptional regulator [Paenibacillus qinlingensis]NQX61829.1 helix-turn-helix transcriptional regulator [Paenibacillus qinlingensis]